jgi:DNA-binding transcriptional LysR family regulator
MNWTRLEVFEEVVRQGSLTRAAKKLMYTTSAVSQHISALEREFGAVLFERTPRGVRPTEPGEALLRHVELILEEYRAAQTTVRAVTALLNGRVRVGAFAAANATVVPAAMARFHVEYPHVEMALRQVEPEEAVGLVATRELDLAVTYSYAGERVPGLEGLHVRPLLEDRLHVLLPRDHFLAGNQQVPLTSMMHEKWVQCGNRASTDLVTRACTAAGFVPDIALYCEDESDLPGLTAVGLGVALTFGLSSETLRHDVVARPVAGQYVSRQVLIVSPDGARVSGTITAIEEFLMDAAVESEIDRVSDDICPQRLGA